MKTTRTLVLMDEDQNTLVVKPDPDPRLPIGVVLTMKGVDGFSGDFRLELDDMLHLVRLFKELMGDAKD